MTRRLLQEKKGRTDRHPHPVGVHPHRLHRGEEDPDRVPPADGVPVLLEVGGEGVVVEGLDQAHAHQVQLADGLVDLAVAVVVVLRGKQEQRPVRRPLRGGRWGIKGEIREQASFRELRSHKLI